MTKADIVTKISDRLGVEKIETQAIIEQFMKEVKSKYLSDRLKKVKKSILQKSA